MSNNHSDNILLESGQVGDLTLSNRFVMASLTRVRADFKTGIPTDLHAQYYAQRATSGLIITEASPISQHVTPTLGAGGIYSKEQIEGWKLVNEAVHAKGSKVFIQLWHGGRAAHPTINNGVQPIAPSPIAIREPYRQGIMHVEPREMTKDDIKNALEKYRQAAINAKQAGFDGVELHGANGYLVDQFLRDGSNKRTDEYGGSIENRARFALEAIDVLIEVFGAKRVGIKISPVGRYQDMYDSDPIALYSYLLTELDKRGIAYVQIMEAELAVHPNSVHEVGGKQVPEITKALRSYFKNGAVMINGNLDPTSAEKALKEGIADFAVFGRYFISNPDLVNRVRNGYPLNAWDVKTFYAGGETGYLDYKEYDVNDKDSYQEHPDADSKLKANFL